VEKKKALFREKQGFYFLARPERFERPTLWFVAKYSIQLSYGRQGVTTLLQQGQRFKRVLHYCSTQYCYCIEGRHSTRKPFVNQRKIKECF
jgi:hypothetical protein